MYLCLSVIDPLPFPVLFEHDSIRPFPEKGHSKKEQIIAMFDHIAPRYDRLNAILSCQIHKRWRKRAIRILADNPPEKLLDIACGTGDFAIAAKARFPSTEIIGIDISEAMLRVGKEKIRHKGLESITLQLGDGENMPFPNASFDAITIGFGVRNFQDLQKGLRECYRTLKDEGRLIILEFSTPSSAFIRKIYSAYSQYIIPFLGRILAQNKQAYAYLDKSARHFPYGAAFASLLKNTGFTHIQFQPLSFGICTLYYAQK